MIWFLLGVIVGFVIKDVLPPDIVVKQGKVKNKKSGDLNNEQTLQKPGLIRRIFKRKKHGGKNV